MSFRKPLTLQLSPKARQDFIDILRYTGVKWGQSQLLAYRDWIDEALQSISRNPQLGHRRSDLPGTHLAYVVGSHMIIYSCGGKNIGVVRILHQRMSLGKHLWAGRCVAYDCREWAGAAWQRLFLKQPVLRLPACLRGGSFSSIATRRFSMRAGPQPVLADIEVWRLQPG